MAQSICFPSQLLLRGSVVQGHVVVGVVGGGLSSILTADHLGIAVSRSRRLAGRRGRAILQDGASHAGVVSDGLAADKGGRALRERRAGGRTQRRSCESVEGRHGRGEYMWRMSEVARRAVSLTV
jgi:hypothetical protein